MAYREVSANRSFAEPGTVPAPDFPAGLGWLNTARPVSLRDLRGKVVLLDFWTYCCVNCYHALEEVKRLERKYENELVVIGVHSGKFNAEKDTDRIRQAVLRLGIRHPVVNDTELDVLAEYGMQGWPSFILIDPGGNVFGSHRGESVYELFDRVVGQMVEHYEALGQIDRAPLDFLEREAGPDESLLRFPGKVLADEAGGRLFVADSGHHRILVSSLAEGTVLDAIGTGEPGLADGGFGRARLQSPQGMALSGESLYIADTGNHAVRCADLVARTVRTVAGDGHVDLDWDNSPGPVEGRRLNSPWDLEIEHGVLFVAMAGSHQIFGIDLEGGYMAGHAGSGKEDHVDGPLLAAALAQPSGLSSDGRDLFVADSEISSIRAVSLDPRGGHVRTVVGKGLYDFGDIDGVGEAVLMQHPMGIVASDGRLYVADTYNNKIKRIELSGLSVSTLAGTGYPGHRNGPGREAQFNEPAGLSIAGGKLYVADTNNHCVRTVDVESGEVGDFDLSTVG